MKKELYVQPALAKHELLRDITAKKSGYGGGKNNGKGNGFGKGWGFGKGPKNGKGPF